MLEREVSMLRAQCGSGCCGEGSAMGKNCLFLTTKHLNDVGFIYDFFLGWRVVYLFHMSSCIS